LIQTIVLDRALLNLLTLTISADKNQTMTKSVNRICVILASPSFDQDARSETPRRFCKNFILEAQKKGIHVDLIDLYQDEEFDPVWQPEKRDTKAMEYQIRLSKADLVVFFHPIWWASLPGILKGFIDKVFLPGFAFSYDKHGLQKLLTNKSLWIYTFSDRPVWEYRFLQRDAIRLFWDRAVAGQTGLKLEKYRHFGSLRKAREKQVNNWEKQILKEASRLNSKDGLLDLL
jgi:NAD(P)H dehydrogenase (quinone)